MWKVMQLALRRAGRSGARFADRRVPAAGRAGSVPGSEAAAGRALSRQLCSVAGRKTRSCTVDPDLQEQFVFVDCSDPEEDKDLHQLRSSSSPPQAPPPLKHRRPLAQLQVLRGVAQQEVDPASLIQFQDVDFPLDEAVVSSQKKKKKKPAGGGEHKVFGSPDPALPVSGAGCAGCGAVLHCAAAGEPGYLPSQKYSVLLRDGGLAGATCQRCHLLTHHHKALSLRMTPDQYRAVVSRIRPLRALVLLVVDLLDLPDSVVPDLAQLVGTNKRVLVLGNKADLLPGDSPDYLQRIKRRLSGFCRDAGFGDQVTDVRLISAKTGYGVEDLVSSLQRTWRYQGDVYLVGSANAGKSTLFNALLESDYCKSRATDLVHKATISPWPGTTLNLLKFPIINPTPSRMFRRDERLKKEDELPEDELRTPGPFSRHGYLVGRVGRTFLPSSRSQPDEIQFDPDSLAFGENEDEETKITAAPRRSPDEFSFNELKDAHWLFDTPGILKENDILGLLTEQEVMSVVPTQALVPRTFVLKPSMSLLLGALARIDFLQGGRSCWFSVLVSSRVPVHITSLEKADGVYEKHAGHELLGVPLGGSERMKRFPALVPQEVMLEGRGYLEASGDVKLSSAGWVAVTAAAGDQLLLRVHGPPGAVTVRTPALLPHIVALKGERLRKSAAYKTIKTPGSLDGGGERKRRRK